MQISKGMLDKMVAKINTEAGTPLVMFDSAPGAPSTTANTGHYYLHGAYGGYQLCAVQDSKGGARSLTCGYSTKKEIYKQLQAFLAGMQEIRRP